MQPFFTVVIPTKNRSFVVTNAVQSILQQTFGDFEILVIDNDDTDATQEVLRTIQDKRLRILRSGGLTMSDNWEYGYRHAQGIYRILLEDKSVMKPRALKKIHSALEKQPSELVSWPQDLFNDRTDSPFVARGSATAETRVHSSDEILNIFLSKRRGVAENYLPRGMNSALHVDLYNKICRGPVGRLCPPVSPDYTMAFLQLNYTECLLHIDDCLTVYGSCKLSHGWRTTIGVVDKSHLQSDFGMPNFDQYWKPEIPAPVHVTAAFTFNDFLSIRRQVDGRLRKHTPPVAHFFLETYRDIKLVEGTGVPMPAAWNAWRKGIRQQPAAVRNEVRRTLALESLQPAWRIAFETSALAPLWRRLKRRFGWIPPTEGEEPNALRHKTPMDYIIWENQNTVGTV